MLRFRHNVLVAEDIALRKAVIPLGVDEFRDGPEIVLVVPGFDLDREDREGVVIVREEVDLAYFLAIKIIKIMPMRDEFHRGDRLVGGAKIRPLVEV